MDTEFFLNLEHSLDRYGKQQVDEKYKVCIASLTVTLEMISTFI
jgi:hypothetical protein